ncbi:hypothetical protein [Cohnella herbarum]|uniref:Uncharacterized protein n=1 Tax=Cohnella herbarum TaxID=2728023 RepID=A0A7Z2VMF6_9BACL|nr:hypothetical protein [Cohnella herbarum]QJD85953.1 hypothetical protein HH215_24095 [Cohnella herbarum]
MSSASLYRCCGIILILGVVIKLVSTIFPFLVSVNIKTSSTDLQDPLVATYYSLTFIAFSLTIIGLPAMYLRQSAKWGKLGLTGLLFYIFGNLLDIAIIATFTTVMPLLSKEAPALIDEILNSEFAIFPLGSFLLCLIGAILFGIAILRAKVFPVYIAALFMASPILYLMSSFVGNDTAGAIFNLLTAVSLGIALGKVGVSLATGRHEVASGNSVSSAG